MNPDRSSQDRAAVPPSRRRALSLLIAAVAVATIPAIAFGWRALSEMSDQLRAGRIREAEILASQVDGFVNNAFFDLELAAAAMARGPNGDLARRLDDGIGSPNLGGAVLVTLLFDDRGEIVATTPATFTEVSSDPAGSGEVASVVAASTNSISPPFGLADGNQVVAALGVPIFAPTGGRVGTLVGLVDLSGPVMAGFIEPARRIGATGHADLVDDRGMVLVSTNPNHVLGTGDHPEFYAAAAELRTPVVRSVPHHAGLGDVDLSPTHVMAWVPLRNAPWAVVLGAAEQETMAPVAQLRRTLVAAGIASLLVLTVGVAAAFRMWPLSPKNR